MILLKNILIHLLTAAFFVVFWVPVLLTLPLWWFLPQRAHLVRKLLVIFGRIVVKVIWRMFFKVRYEDVRQDKSTGGRIIIVNHRAASDAFLVGMMGECCAQTVNGWPLRNPILGPVARMAGYLDITRMDFEELKQRAAEIFAAGDVIVSFPEGTRAGSRQMNVFHSGIFHLARELDVPLGILCIAGNEEMPDRKFRYRKFHDILVRRLPDMTLETVRQMPSAFALKKAVNLMMKEELARMDRQLDDEKQI